jgi:uncharacterized repeat protein (TIGR01451 family)
MNPLNSLKPQRSLPTHPQPLTWAWLGAIATGLSLLGPLPAAFAAGEIQVTTTFDPNQISQGGPGKLKYTIRNATTALTGAALTKTIPAGFVLDIANFPANVPSAANSCGLTIGTSTATSLRITGGTLPAVTIPPVGPPVSGRCDLELPIIGKKAPDPSVNFDMPIGQFSAGGFSNTEVSLGGVTVRQLGNLSPTMSFSPRILPSKGHTKFTLGMVNGTGIPLTGAKFSTGFTIPAGFTLIGTPTNTCTGAVLDPVSLALNPPVIKLTNGIIPITGCSFEFEFEGPTVATETTFGPISWGANDLITNEEVSNNATTSNGGTIEGGIKVEQSFNLNPVYINEESTLTIRIRNANATAIAGNTLNAIINNVGGTTADRGQLKLGAGGTGGVTSTCGAAPIAAYTPATGLLQLTNVSTPTGVLVPAAAAAVGECTITVQVVGTQDPAAVPTYTSIGDYTSTIATGQLFAAGQASNQKVVTAAGLKILDLQGVTGGIGVGVGIRTEYSSDGANFGTKRVAASNRGVMRIFLDNLAGETLNGVAIGGTGVQLPANIRIADTGAVGGTCGAGTVVTAPANGAAITMTGGVIPRRGTCYIDIDIVSDNFNLTPGYSATAAANVISTTPVAGQANRSYTNAVMAAGPNYLEVNDFLTVYPSMTTPVVAPNANARIKLSLHNSQNVAKANAKLRYKLPFAIAGPTNYAWSAGCGALTANDFSIDPAGPFLVNNKLTIPASTGSKAPAAPIQLGDGTDGICDIEFNVQAPAELGDQPVDVVAGTLTDSTGAQQNRRPESTKFNVKALTLDLSQRFTSFAAPTTTITELVGAEPAFIEVQLTNPTSNPLGLTNIILDDTLEDVTALFYPGAKAFTTCAGVGGPAVPTMNPATKKFRLTGADLAVGASCIVRYPVTTLSVALLTNEIPLAAAISAEGAKSNLDKKNVTTSPNIGLVKDFETQTLSATGLPQIATDGIARLNLTVLNATTQAYNDLALVDNLPDGLKVAAIPNIVSTCGVVSAPAEAVVIRLNGGSIPANAPCKISLNVTSLIPSPATGYENNIPIGGLKAGIFKNSKPAIANLLVTGTTVQRPGLRLVKRATALNIPANAITGTAAAAIDLTTISVDDIGSFDNAPGWPLPLDLTSGISTYLKGATDTAQLALPGKQALTSGTEVEYSGYYLSNGTVGTTNVKLCDFIPANTTYKAGSLVWVNGAGVSIPVTDATGFLPATTTAFPAVCPGPNTNNKGAVIVSPGTLTNTGTGSYGYFKFKVTID